MKRLPLLVLTSVLALPLALNAWGAPSEPREPAEPEARAGRVVLLGFDGADARTVRELVAASPGAYPTFEKLASEGTFAPLEVVAPPESPVSWAAINTGQNPAKTGVPGFIRRNLDKMSPDFGHIEFNVPVDRSELDGVPEPAAGGTSKGLLAGLGAFVVLALVVQLATKKAALAALVGLVGGSAAGFFTLRHFEAEAAGYMPQSFPVTRNPNKADNFWDHAARAGVETIVLDAAQAFDQPAPEGARVLAGLGVPDAKGMLGEWAIYTTDPEEVATTGRKTNTAGIVFRVDAYGGEINTKLWGIENFWEKERLQAELDEVRAEQAKPVQRSMEDNLELSNREQELEDALAAPRKDNTALKCGVDMKIKVDGQAADVTIGGATQRVGVGDWSEFYELEFVLNPALSVKAITRVRLVSVEPHVELFVNVLDIDPREPPFWQPISSPHGFAAELAADCGLYETYGWPTTTMPVKDGEVDPELLMEDVEFTMKWREKLTYAALARDDWRLLMSVFSTTDRVQHMMYQFYDVEHPLYDAEVASREMTFFGETIKLSEAIPAIYEQMDRVIGEVLARLGPEDTLLVCSDHGFQSFRRQVHVNNWLIEEGYQAYKPDAPTTKALFYVDWEKTRVYSLGMGFLYVNMQGRERDGIVPPEEADALMAEVREKLLTATDPETGARFCKDVYITKEVHNGPYLDLESDMLIGFAPPYRVSWASTSGGISARRENRRIAELNPVCVDNDSPWSGGHISVHLPDVAGVFFSNRKVSLPDDGVKALQLAPTVLDLVGVTPPAEMDLEPLEIR